MSDQLLCLLSVYLLVLFVNVTGKVAHCQVFILIVRVTIFNAVKCNLTKITTKKSWHSLGGQQLLVGSACTEHHIVIAFKHGGA